MPMPMPPQNPAALAGGGPPTGGQPPVTTAAPGNSATTDINAVVEALKQVLQQAVDENGYVDVNRLVTMWPQFSDVPFQVVMQLIQQSPEILNQLISQYGLNGLIVNGRIVAADELASLGQGGA